MTSLVGILCTDGVVIGADSSATSASADGIRTIEQPTKKIFVVENEAILAGTGAIGLNQRFLREVELGCREKDYTGKKAPIERMSYLSRRGLVNFEQTGTSLQFRNINYGALLAGSCEGKPFLCEFEAGSMQPEMKSEHFWYVSMGSGQHITDTFLGFIRRVLWNGRQPSTEEGVFCAVWTLQQAIDLNPGGINGPIKIAVLKRSKTNNWVAEELDQGTIDLHLGFTGDVERLMASNIPDLLLNRPSPSTPSVPAAGD